MPTSSRLPLGLSIAALAISVVGFTLALAGFVDDEARPSDAARELFAPQSDRGYSMASRYGDLVWTAGHLPESASPGDDVAKQTALVMDGLAATLREAGAGFDSVVMTNVYLTDFDDWDAFNSVYTQYFTGELPPRVTVQVGQLGIGDIEISMVAHVHDR